ncbi:hypothetical protein PMAYCL1PPCAC_23712, partial [Pristionchus mayeri]
DRFASRLFQSALCCPVVSLSLSSPLSLLKMEPSSSYGSPREDVRMMPLFEEGESEVVPMARDRCNTWPLRRPQMDLSSTTSPLVHEGIPEERDDCSSSDQLNVCGLSMGEVPCGLNDSSNAAFSPFSSRPVMEGGGGMGAKKKRCRRKPPDQLAQKKPNPWGEESYSDLIAKALESSPDGRLKLNEIYQWFSDHVQYFRERSSQEEAAGWKNSIRHNLSLHSRFMRIQNEGAGKSSWWVINPDAKPGRNPRRTRATTMDTATKAVMDKKRRGARKKVMDMRGSSSALSVSSSGVGGSTSSMLSHEVYSGQPTDESLVAYDLFRGRAASTSVVSSSLNRSSPTLDQFEDFDFPPWVDSSGATTAVAIPSDILDRTDQMRIDPTRGPNGLPREIKQEMKTVIKQEPGVAPPPSYQELSSVRGPQQLTQNPLLRGQLMKPTPTGIPYLTNLNSYAWGPPGSSSQFVRSHCLASGSSVSSSYRPREFDSPGSAIDGHGHGVNPTA